MPKPVIVWALALITCSFLYVAASALGQTFSVDSGITLNNGLLSQGCSWIDIDADHDLDLYVSTAVFSSAAANLVFLNNGAGGFSQSLTAPLATDLTSTAIQTWGDYDNDGRTDLLVCNPGSTNILYHNSGGGVFTKPSVAMTTTSGSDYAAAWGDYDNDSYLDIVICTRDVVGPTSGTTLELYHNNGNETFTLQTAAPVATTLHNYSYPTWTDIDSDGDLDLFVSTGAPVANENDVVFRNLLIETSTAQFTADTLTGLSADSSDGLFPAWGDYDNDGFDDLFLTTWGGIAGAKPNMLYHADGTGTFSKVTNPATGTLITNSNVSTGATWGDYDNDGDLDIFVSEQTSADDKLFRNNGDGTFTDVTAAVSIASIGGYASHGAAWGDYDRDGDLDLFVTYGYFSPGSRNRLLKNSGNGNHWLQIACRGYSGNNASGIGARISIKAILGGVPTWQHRTVTSTSGFFSTNLEQHFGLLDATVVDSIIVRWPSGFQSIRSSVAADQFITIEDCADLDGDGVYCTDNCPAVANPWQEDANSDGIGDACCCIGSTGNIDCDSGNGVDISDLSALIDNLYITFAPLCCPKEANVDGQPGIDIADLSGLIDYLYISFAPTAACQ